MIARESRKFLWIFERFRSNLVRLENLEGLRLRALRLKMLEAQLLHLLLLLGISKKADLLIRTWDFLRNRKELHLLKAPLLMTRFPFEILSCL